MSFIKNITYILLTVYYVVSSSIIKWFDKSGNKSLRQHQKWGVVILKLFNVKVSVDGLEHLKPETSYLIAPNHQSLIDIPVMFSVFFNIKFKFIVKSEYFKFPFLASGLRSADHTSIDRHNFKKGLRTLEAVAEKSRTEKSSILIFPEGTRSADGKIQEFKKGISLLLQRAGMPVLPVVIKGTFDFWPKSRVFPIPGKNNVVKVKILKPLNINISSKKDRNEFVANLQKQIEDAYENES